MTVAQCQGPPGAPRSWKLLQRSSPRASGGNPAHTLALDVWLPGLQERTLLRSQAAQWGSCVPQAALERDSAWESEALSSVETSRVGPSCSLTPRAASLPACVAASGEIPGNPGRPGDWVWKAQTLKSPLAPASGGPRGPRLSWAASFDLLSQGEAISAKVGKCGLRSAVRAGRKWGNAQKCLRPGRPCPFALKPQLRFFQPSEQP